MVPGIPLAEQEEDVLAGTTGEHKLTAQLARGSWHEHYRDAIPIVSNLYVGLLLPWAFPT